MAVTRLSRQTAPTVVVATAMIDRLIHHAEILSLKGDSYRLRGKELGLSGARLEFGATGPDAFPFEPPTDVDNLVTRLWDQFLPGWRERHEAKGSDAPDGAPDVMARMQGDGEELAESEWPAQPDFVVVKKRVPPRRGRWRILPEPSSKRGESNAQ